MCSTLIPAISSVSLNLGDSSARGEFQQISKPCVCPDMDFVIYYLVNLPALLLLLMQRNAKSKHCIGLALVPYIVDRIQIECEYRWYNYTNH